MLQSIQPIGGSAGEVDSSATRKNKVHLHAIHLEPVTVQLHSRQRVDSTVRI